MLIPILLKNEVVIYVYKSCDQRYIDDAATTLAELHINTGTKMQVGKAETEYLILVTTRETPFKFGLKPNHILVKTR